MTAATGTWSYGQSLHSAIEASQKGGNEGFEPGLFVILSVQNIAALVEGFGHEYSESVITGLIQEIIPLVQKSRGCIDRLQRDQIGIVIPHCEDEKLPALVSSLRNCARDFGRHMIPYPVQINPYIATTRIRPTGTPLDIINEAYVALHLNNGGRIIRPYEALPDQRHHIREEMALAVELRNAVADGKLRLSYQPIIASDTGRTSHYECLLRLVNDSGKICSAGSLVPIAERMGLIDTIDRMVMEMATQELAESPDVTLAFNVSGLTTRNREWLDRFREIINAHPDIAGRIILEVTETAAQESLAETAYFVACVQAMGCQVALDDFGAGYTSFRQLKALSVDMVKIDGLFIRDMVENPDHRFFVRTLIDFARGFGLKSVAEWVEDGETAKILMEMGIGYMQGYYFAAVENHRSWLSHGEYEAE